MTKLKLILAAILAIFARLFALPTLTARRGDNKRRGFNLLSALCMVFLAAAMTACGPNFEDRKRNCQEEARSSFNSDYYSVPKYDSCMKDYDRKQQESTINGIIILVILIGVLIGVIFFFRNLAPLPPNTQSHGTNTPAITLNDAVWYGQTKTVISFIKAGVNLNKRDCFGKTPLDYAVERHGKNSEIARILQQAILNALIENHGRNSEIVRALRKEIDKSDNEGRPTKTKLALVKDKTKSRQAHKPDIIALHQAIENGKTENAITLIKAGTPANAKDSNGWTPLHFAACHSQTEIVLALIKAGARLDMHTDDDKTPLNIAVEKHGKDSDIARILREAMEKQSG